MGRNKINYSTKGDVLSKVIRNEAKDWYEGALIDLEEACSALAGKRYNWALFAAHQAVEKALKAAYIVIKRSKPPRVHDLTRLINELNIGLPDELRIGISELSPYYLIARYPNAGLERPWESIDKSTAERLIKVAEEVVKLVGRTAGLR
ncbi:MAG: DNA-binding protein [Thermoprotei archaeon]|nr:MAG: DNA-binding protein [Thermoprotei archaeon]HDI31477.1 HEPN domain-containing protein [Thermofilum sp.]